MLPLTQIHLILSIKECTMQYFSSHLHTNYQKEFDSRDNTENIDMKIQIKLKTNNNKANAIYSLIKSFYYYTIIPRLT